MPRAALSPTDIADYREEICGVAERLFAEQGYPGVTLRAIASELGVSAMTPYRYFRGKDDIFAAVRASAFRRFADAQEAAFASHSDPETRLRALARSYLAFGRDEPHAYRIMFEMNPLGDTSRWPELTAQQHRGWEPLVRAVTAAVEAGVLAGDPTHLAHVFWAGVHGVVALHLAGTYTIFSEDFEHVAETMEATLFEGNRARPARQNRRRK
jgi:AcrR family transcriptional regulator